MKPKSKLAEAASEITSLIAHTKWDGLMDAQLYNLRKKILRRLTRVLAPPPPRIMPTMFPAEMRPTLRRKRSIGYHPVHVSKALQKELNAPFKGPMPRGGWVGKGKNKRYVVRIPKQ